MSVVGSRIITDAASMNTVPYPPFVRVYSACTLRHLDMTRSARCRFSFIFLLAILSRFTPGPFLPLPTSAEASPPGRLMKPSAVTASGSSSTSASSPSGVSKRASRLLACGALRNPSGVTTSAVAVDILTTPGVRGDTGAGFACLGAGSSTKPRAFFLLSTRTFFLGASATSCFFEDFFRRPICATSWATSWATSTGSTGFWRVSN
mmetsp:Transcript_12376/g.57239  ORF Transcript_12376/g.57239 Transcript_12376/m.57239 type:complete len:206 (+) Transcript_12376:988-1605(+)